MNTSTLRRLLLALAFSAVATSFGASPASAASVSCNGVAYRGGMYPDDKRGHMVVSAICPGAEKVDFKFRAGDRSSRWTKSKRKSSIFYATNDDYQLVKATRKRLKVEVKTCGQGACVRLVATCSPRKCTNWKPVPREGKRDAS